MSPGEFERVACALLQPLYPGLSAVEGGHDFGRDGDIYFPLPGSGPDARGRLMVTTGDPVDNMRGGLRRLVEEEQRVDLVVMICSRAVSARTRRSLAKLCQERDLPDPHVFARSWLVIALVNSPLWRERLTGVAGRLESLLDSPLVGSASEGIGSAEIFGRDAERQQAQQFIDDAVDFVVTGQPGVGKTRLVQELAREVKFLMSAEQGQVLDDLLSARPAAVVVDDAQMRLPELGLLRRARQQEDLSFSIVATTWPDKLQEVAEYLPGASELMVPPLVRADVDALLQAVGVTGHRARLSILDQARGRPGWALALCDLLLNGDGFQVATGSALVANVERFLLASTGSETSVDALACVAAIGHATTKDVQRLAPLVGIAPADLSGLFYRLAHNGLLSQATGAWSLQPSLLGPLIARWFFVSPARRDMSTVVDVFPERTTRIDDGVLLAAQTGSEPAQRAADVWAAEVISRGTLTAAVLDNLVTYSTLSERAARVAIQAVAPAIQRNPHDTSPYSVVHAVVQCWALPEAVAILLDSAIGDGRARHQTPEHPLRVLAETAARVEPDVPPDIRLRERILDATLDWLVRGSTPERWLVAAEAVAGALSPTLEGLWPSVNTVDGFVIARAVPPAVVLRRLAVLWGRVLEPFGLTPIGTEERCPVEAARLLVGLAGEWVWLAREIASSGRKLSPEQISAASEGARLIIESLRVVCERHPGLGHMANSFLDGADPVVASSFTLDVDLQGFIGMSRPPSLEPEDLQRHLDGQAASSRELAEKLVNLGVAAGVARFAQLAEQAKLAGHLYVGHEVARLMAPQLVDPGEWYLAARDAQLQDLASVALTESYLRDSARLPASVVRQELRKPDRRPLMIRSALRSTVLNDSVALVIEDLQGQDAFLLAHTLVRDEVDDVLHRLLVHPVPEIAAAAALQFDLGEAGRPTLPDSWRDAWNKAFVNARGDSDDHAWPLGRILRHLVTHDPDLAEEWFKARLSELSAGPYPQRLSPRDCETYLAGLPAAHRGRLARHYLALGRVWNGRRLLAHLVGRDVSLAESLLDEGLMSIDHVLGAIGGGEGVVDHLGPLALRRGVAPALIAEAACPSPDDIWDEVQEANSNLDYYRSLAQRVPELVDVSAVGIAEQQTRLREAEERQNRARLRGEHS